MLTQQTLPAPVAALIASPLRNRLRVELHASVAEVWALLGDLARYPEYSAGLERVDAKVDADGRCTEFACYFKPLQPGAGSIVSREAIRWWEPNRGYASSSAGANAFGRSNDLNLLLLDAVSAGAIVTVDEYYDAVDLPMMKAHFDEAFADIGANLVRRFGGRVVERYMET